MPIALSPPMRPKNGLTKFTNCRLLRGLELVEQDLWVSSVTGKIIDSQSSFYDELHLPDATIDLGGRILAPGMVESQLNGAYGFNFSTLLDDMRQYGKSLREVNRKLVATGVTSYTPTITSQKPELYQKALPLLGPSGRMRLPDDGAESLGAHCEGPFLSPTKNGVHNPEAMLEAFSFRDLEDCYGSENLNPTDETPVIPVKVITAAPERGRMTDLIPDLRARGIIYSIGHSEATYEEASKAVANGATMITHLFNAMRPLHHRNPGVFGVLGRSESSPKPYFGIIADGVHLHPTTIKIAFDACPEGFILVTDAMHLVGMPDGVYPWVNGGKDNELVKSGNLLLLKDTDTIAGSTITLLECVNNFLKWTGYSVPQALRAVTATPAAMLGLEGVKGSLEAGADADLMVLSEEEGNKQLRLDEVWKFGVRVSRSDAPGVEA